MVCSIHCLTNSLFFGIPLLILICINWVRGDPRTIFLVTSFTEKNARKLRFHVFLPLCARKHMISSFYPKWTEFTRNCEFPSKYGSRGNQTKLEQNSQFLVNSVHFR